MAPHWFEPFFILGKYYQNYKQDASTAKRCFLKAFQLNPRSDSVGIALSDIYRSLGLVEENVQLLEAVTAFGAKWAKLRLGNYLFTVLGNILFFVYCITALLRISLNPNNLQFNIQTLYPGSFVLL